MIVDSIEGIVEYGARIADKIDEGLDRLQCSMLDSKEVAQHKSYAVH